MLTGKQRAYLRGLANQKQALYQIGKNGIDENLVKMIEEALEANELVKVHVLETAPGTCRELCGQLAQALEAEAVQVIGGKFVLYKESRNKKTIELPEAKKER